jgi:hypothetical protein
MVSVSYLLISQIRSRFLHEKLIVTLLLKESPAFYETWRFTISVHKKPATGHYTEPDN